jgi:hypothetical protein
MNAAGMRRLLDLGVLDYLLPRLAEASESESRQCSALNLLQQIGRSGGGANAPLLVRRGILTKLREMVQWHRDPFLRDEACAVLAVVLRGCTSVEVDVAVQDGLISVLVAFFRRGSSRCHTAVPVLTYICLRGSDAHRRALIAHDVLPVLVEMALRRTHNSAALQPELRFREESDFVLDQLRALALLLRAAKSLDAKADAAIPPAAATKPSTAQCISRADLEPLRLLDHWHPEVRDEVSKLLQEHFD